MMSYLTNTGSGKGFSSVQDQVITLTYAHLLLIFL